MKKDILAVVAITGLFGSTVALAENGFYVDASIGQMTANIPAAAGGTTNKKDTTFSLGGGYKFNDYLGAEVGYQDLGKVGYFWTGAGTTNFQGNVIVGTGALSLNAKTDGFYFGPTLSYPVNDQFSVNARAGWYNWTTQATLNMVAAGTINGTAFAAGATGSAKASGTDNYIGLGATYNVSKNVGINLNYTQYKVSSYKADNFTIGARYSF